MEFITNNLPEVLLTLGLVLLTIEVVILGFSTFFLFFLGLALLLTSGLLYLDIIPETTMAVLVTIATSTAIFGVFLWKPLLKLQNKQDTKKARNDMIGHEFVLPDSVSPNMSQEQLPHHLYSGINWRLTSDVTIEKGERVQIVDVSVGMLKVAPLGMSN